MKRILSCAYCCGTGKDPFELLSPISDCLTCRGTGQVEVENPMIRCVFCTGTGKNPLGARISCIVCGGKGYNNCESKSKCIVCYGNGRSLGGLPCSNCLGKGYKDS